MKLKKGLYFFVNVCIRMEQPMNVLIILLITFPFPMSIYQLRCPNLYSENQTLLFFTFKHLIMAKTSETGHAKNVANFATLITVVKGFKAAYNPSKQTITLSALTDFKTVADDVMGDLNAKLGPYSTAIAAREVAFEPLSKLSTRIINALRATDASPAVIKSAEALVRKLQGKRATAKKTEEELAALEAEGTAVKQVSSSQMSFDNRIENFNRLIQLLVSIPEYAPNEEELKTTSLTTYCQSLKTTNDMAVDLENSVDNARIARNEVLYKPAVGLVDRAAAVKLYVKSLFGATSAQYKLVSGLKFMTVK